MKFVTFVESGLTRAGVLVGDATRPTDIVIDLAHPATLFVDLEALQPQKRLSRLHVVFNSGSRMVAADPTACDRKTPRDGDTMAQGG